MRSDNSIEDVFTLFPGRAPQYPSPTEAHPARRAAIVLTALLAMSAAQVVAPRPAHADAPIATGSSSCVGTEQVVTWSLASPEAPAGAEHPMTIVFIGVSSGSVVGLSVGDILTPSSIGPAANATTNLPGDQAGSVTLTVIGSFGNDLDEAPASASVDLTGDCISIEPPPPPDPEPPEPPPSDLPTITPSAEITPSPSASSPSPRPSPSRTLRRSARPSARAVGAVPQGAEATVGLGTAGSFAVLAGSTITNTGSTTIYGDIGLHPGSAVTGFGSVTQTGGSLHVADAVAQQAKVDRTAAYGDAAGRGPATTVLTELGGQVLLPGVYSSQSGTFGITGTLQLDAQGDPSAVWIFQTASTLVTATSSAVLMINGGSYCNVFWKIGSSATLGTGTQFKGTILAAQSITLGTGSTIDGRALAGTGAVTMRTNTITRTSCAATPAPTGTGSGTGSPTGSTPPPTITPSITPTLTPSGGGPKTPTVAPPGPDTPPGSGGHPPPLVGAPVTGGPTGRLLSWSTGPSPVFASADLPPAQRIGASDRMPRLVPARLPLRAPAIALPLRLRIPALGLRAPILGVGITPDQAMDAPMGSANDPVWGKAFWYRGGGIPGAPGTATIAGHVSGGSDPLFANLGQLRRGDDIVVAHRERDRAVRFTVTEIRTFALHELGPDRLRRIYGSGPVAGRRARTTHDGVSRLALITCAGDRLASGYEHRLVVFATRVDPRAQPEVPWASS